MTLRHLAPRSGYIKRSPLKRAKYSPAKTGNELRQRNSTTCGSGHKHDSVPEAGCCDMLTFLQKSGLIRGLEIHVHHKPWGDRNGMGCSCKCSDVPPGVKKLRGVIPDFQFDEKQNDGTWKFIVADYKGWLDKTSGQWVAYEIFEAVHGFPIRLYTAKGLR